jgi:hypothetical protein
MIDQQIWPLLFFSFADTNGNIDENMRWMTRALSECYNNLLMPHMPEDEKNLTVMSTVFALSDLFSSQLWIQAKLFELWITEKTFAMIYMYQSKNEYIFLPSAINPTAIVIDQSIQNQKLESYLGQLGIWEKRVAIKSAVTKKESSQWNSLLLIRQDHWIKMINLVTGAEYVLDDMEWIQEWLKLADAKIFQWNLKLFESTKDKNIFQTTCNDCIKDICEKNNWMFNGKVYPNEPGICSVCGKQWERRMFLTQDANARAKEKSK